MARLFPLTADRSLLTLFLFTVHCSLFTQFLSAQDSTRSSRSGVFTRDQAVSGQELYAFNCAHCHTPVSHSGAAFVAKWEGHLLSELFDFVRNAMPKSDPGSLTRREYILVTAYLLKLNGMPAGNAELPSDSLGLSRIRLNLKQADSTRLR